MREFFLTDPDPFCLQNDAWAWRVSSLDKFPIPSLCDVVLRCDACSDKALQLEGYEREAARAALQRGIESGELSESEATDQLTGECSNGRLGLWLWPRL